MTVLESFHAQAATFDGWSDDPGVLTAASLDRSGWVPSGVPLGLARPGDVAQVRRVLTACHAHGVPVVPRGAGTGLAGGATAGSGTVVLDLGGLDTIDTIDPVDRVAVVGPGVLTADLDRAAGAHGLRYAPDPASAELSTIGGNIATNAGGMRCVRHGVTRDAVLGLDVLLADGRLVTTGRRTGKQAAGLDLTSLFVGSEGTLGVIVGATLRLHPIPAATATAVAHFTSVEDAAEACGELRIVPSLLELLDAATLRAIDTVYGTHLGDGTGALVIVQTEGLAAEAEMTRIVESLAARATRVQLATSDAEAAALLAARRRALPAIEQLARPLIEDIAVPRSRLAEAVRGVERIAAETGVPIYTFAHAGDGNLHPIIAVPRSGPVPAAARAAADLVFELAVALDGTISGEHGVGVLKRDWLRREIGEDALAVHRSIKAALDPRGILNPGKGF